jgi:nucleoside-diphosphate-sugar epimerase
MELINVFGGSGFIGSRYCEMTPNVIVNDRNDLQIKSKDVLYFISTIDNYNVLSDPYVDIETNIKLLIDTLHNRPKDKDLTFNFVSSWFVYGNVSLPAKESALCDPKGFYSITKRTAEQLLISYCETFNIKYRILRLANVLGETDHKVSAKKNALQYMIDKVKNNEDINLYDGGHIFRDYIYVNDVVDAINLILEKGETNQIYNIGNGSPVYICDVIKKVKAKTGSTSHINSIKTVDFHKTVQTKNMVLDITKIKNLGYQQKFSIDQIIDILIK